MLGLLTRVSIVATLCSLVFLSARASADAISPCQSVDLSASYNAKTHRARGIIKCIGAKDDLEILRYPAAINQKDAYTDVNGLWHYPQGFEEAQMQLWNREGDRIDPGEEQSIRLKVSAQDAARGIRFSTFVPRRRGPFGRHQDLIFLLGGWHPVFSIPGDKVHPQTIHYQLQGSPKHMSMAAYRTPHRGPKKLKGSFSGRFLPWLMAPEIKRRKSTHATLWVPVGDTYREDKIDSPLPLGLRDVAYRREKTQQEDIQNTLSWGADFLSSRGIKSQRPFQVVITPMVESIALPIDDGIALSHRSFKTLKLRMFKSDLFDKFHRGRIWREQFRHAIAHQKTQYTRKRAEFADALGSALSEIFLIERYNDTKTAAEQMEKFAVIPEIDALAFAPQVALADAYYRATDEAAAFRMALHDFDSDAPRGKIWHEKLKHHHGKTAARIFARDQARTPDRYWEAMESAFGLSTRQKIQQFSGPHPSYDLGVRRRKDGQAEVFVQGPDVQAFDEPIDVFVKSKRGKETIRIPKPGIIPRDNPKQVIVDPKRRLVELHHPQGEISRYNNRLKPRWRFLLNNIASLFAVTAGQVSLAADFGLKRDYDLVHRFGFSAFYSPSAVGGSASYSFGFGKKLTPLRLAHRVGLVGSYAYLLRELGSDTFAQLGTLTAFYSHDTRISSWSAFRGFGFNAYARIGLTAGGLGLETYGQVGASILKILPINLNHAFAGRLRGDVSFGNVPSQSLYRLGSRSTAARGYERDEARGPYRVVGTIEYRHVLAPHAESDLGGVFYINRVEGAIFSNAVYLPGACEQDVFFDVGYGFRFMVDVLNLSPSTLSLDIGIPLNRCQAESNRTPFTLYVGFTPPIGAF